MKSDHRPEPAGDGAPGDRIAWRHWALLAAVCAAVVGWYAASVTPGLLEYWDPRPEDAYYNLLVQGFAAGHLHVNKEAPAGLVQLADPYDPRANSRYRWMDRPLHDMSYYKGNLYLYWGATPALLLFWPYFAVTGHFLPHPAAVAFFCSVGFLAGAGLLWAVWRRYFPAVGVAVVAAGTLGLGLATGVWALMAKASVFEVAISCGYALTMLALVALWRALLQSRAQAWWLAAASLMYGLAVGARPTILFGAAVLLIPAIQAWRTGARAGSRRQAWVLLLAAAGPILLVGVGIMLYNALRFDNPLEFGWRYQLAGARQDTAQLASLRYLGFNLRVYFLALTPWAGQFPFVQSLTDLPLPRGHFGFEGLFGGVLVGLPVLWLALAAPAGWRRQPGEAAFALRQFATALALMFALRALTICLFCHAAGRYEMDFLPPLVLLAAIGILSLERALADRPARRRAARWAWGALLTGSVAFSLLANVGCRVEFQDLLGNICFENGQLDKAIAHIQQALKIQPRYANAHSNLGACFMQQGRVDEAISEFQQAVEIRPTFAEAHKNLGRVYLGRGQLDAAEFHFRKALSSQPSSVETHFNLGAILVQKRQLDQAAAEFRTALGLAPRFADAHRKLGAILFQQGQIEEAISEYRKALEIEPGNASAHNNLGGLLVRVGRVEEGHNHFQEALTLNPEYALAHGNLGGLLLQEGRVEEAAAHFQKALALQPASGQFRDNLRQTAWVMATHPQASLRNGAKAVELAEQLNRLAAGTNAVILSTLGAAYAEAGRWSEAMTNAQAALRLATVQHDASLADTLQKQIAGYRTEAPWRDASLKGQTGGTN